MKKDIITINKIMSDMIQKNVSDELFDSKAIELVSEYFVNPPEKYKIGIAEDGIKTNGQLNLGYCGIITHTYILQLYKNSCFDGDMCTGEVDIFGVKLPHHWFELDGKLVFDGLFQNFFIKQEFYELFKVSDRQIQKTSLKEKALIIKIINTSTRNFKLQILTMNKEFKEKVDNALRQLTNVL